MLWTQNVNLKNDNVLPKLSKRQSYFHVTNASCFMLQILASSVSVHCLYMVVFLLVLSETTDSMEEEWQSIADLATACRSILEALSREGQ